MMLLKKKAQYILVGVISFGSLGFSSATVGSESDRGGILAADVKSSASFAFSIFDGTLYKNKPDLSRYGIKPIKIIYENQMWVGVKNSPTLPEPEKIRSIGGQLNDVGGPVVIDIEHWPLKGLSAMQINSNKDKYADLVETFRRYAPTVKFGYYGVIPIPDYWRAIDGRGKPESSIWKNENNAIKSLVRVVDFLAPVAYTFYADRDGWKKYAIAQISEARRLADGKPVYVFLWPQYHESNRILKGDFLAGDYWRLQLDTARQYADGAIIWGGWSSNSSSEKPLKWDESAEWWSITKSFIRSLSN